MHIVGKKFILTMRESTKLKIKKYYDLHPYHSTYKGWVIRTYIINHKYFGPKTYFTCDVRVGVESCQATHLNLVYEWIEEKIKENKIQKEDIWLF